MSIIDSIDVFFDRLKDIRSATQQMVGTLPDLQRWTTGTSLRDLLTTYQHANARHLPEVLAIFDEYSKEPGEDDCKAGLIEGGNGHIEIAGYSVRNLLLVARSLRIGYYLGAAVEVALGVATRSGLAVGADSLDAILTSHRESTAQLKQAGSSTLGAEIGSMP